MAFNFGLNSLMEAVRLGETEILESDMLMETMSDLPDDSMKYMLEGSDVAFIPDDDDIEIDMAGQGIDEDDEEKYERLLSMIPDDDEGIEDQVEELIEAVIPDYI